MVESTCQCRMQNTEFDPFVEMILLRRKWQFTPVLLVWIFPWTRGLVDYSTTGSCRNQTDWAQNHVLNAFNTHTHTDTHKHTHRTYLLQGPRGSSRLRAPGLCISGRHICLSWNMSLRSKCLIWQASGRVLNCSVMETGGHHLLFSFSWWFPSSSSLSPFFDLLYLRDRSLCSIWSQFCILHHRGL